MHSFHECFPTPMARGALQMKRPQTKWLNSAATKSVLISFFFPRERERDPQYMPFIFRPTYHIGRFGQYILECTLINWLNWEANPGQLALINCVTCLTNKEHCILPNFLWAWIEKNPAVWFNFSLYHGNPWPCWFKCNFYPLSTFAFLYAIIGFPVSFFNDGTGTSC